MSNYLFMFKADESLIDVPRWLNGPDEERSFLKIPGIGVGLLIAKRASARVCESAKEIFMGWSVNHDTKSIHVEGSESPPPNWDHEGAWVHIAHAGNGFTIMHDLFGQFPVLITLIPNGFAVSDSMYTLVHMRRSMGLRNPLDSRVLQAHGWSHGLALSPLDSLTVNENIRMLPGFTSARISHHSRSRLKFEPYDMQMVFPRVEWAERWNSYKQAFEQMEGVLRAFRGHGCMLRFGLSGGIDSRLILTMIARQGAGFESVDIRSNTHASRADDLEVVHELSHRLGFEFNQDRVPFWEQTPRLPTRTPNPWGLWMLSYPGLFHMAYTYRSFWPDARVVELGGHGAEVLKGTYANIELRSLVAKSARSRYRSIKSRIREGLRGRNIKTDGPGALRWNHLIHKNGLQAGRFLDRSIIGLRPFLNRALIGSTVHHHHADREVMVDLIRMVDPDGQGLGHGLFDPSSPFTGPSLKVESRQYSIHGDLRGMRGGPPDTLLGIVSDLVSSESDPGDILGMAKHASEAIRASNVKEMDRILELHSERTATSTGYGPSRLSPAARIIALHVLTDLIEDGTSSR